MTRETAALIVDMANVLRVIEKGSMPNSKDVEELLRDYDELAALAFIAAGQRAVP